MGFYSPFLAAIRDRSSEFILSLAKDTEMAKGTEIAQVLHTEQIQSTDSSVSSTSRDTPAKQQRLAHAATTGV